MTDNDIKKALECCYTSYDCEDCPYYCSDKDCPDLLMNALDLINRQKAENESLKVDLAKCSIRLDNLYKTADEIKSEAIKKFAEELEYFVLNEDIEVVEPKCKDYESYINGANQFRHQIKNGINNLVKEMTEVEINQRKEDEGEMLERAIKHFEDLQKRYTREHNGKMCEYVKIALNAMYKELNHPTEKGGVQK